ncbi:helicase-related protein [Paenibacillus sp. LjRoot153]
MPLLFTTSASGMGMNIPDIDGIIHYHIPESIKEYYQHVGRGARTGRHYL